MDGIYMLIKGRQWEAVKERLAREANPDRALRLACREVALEELAEASAFGPVRAGYPQSVDERAARLIDQARARMEAAGG